MNRIHVVETFVRREEAERFIEEVRGDDPDSRATCGSRSGSSQSGSKSVDARDTF